MNVQNHYPFSIQPVPQGQTRFRNQGAPTHMELKRSESEIQVDSYYPQEDFVVRKSGEEVTLDANHPLAGMELTWDIEVVSVRPAGPDNVEQAKE